jgi:uncharacterized linocin/CFP29 family protein
MESNRIENLLEKYFDGETSITEENELKKYFSSSNVAPNLEQYKPLFVFFIENKKETLTKKVNLISTKRNTTWLSIAASIVILLGVSSYMYFNVNEVKENKELGTYDDPKEALEATQKALAMLSNHVNTGVEGIEYIKVYEISKDKIFIK